LLIASGLGSKTLVIDTENRSADLYSHLTEYDVLTLNAPFSPERYIAAIKQGEKAGYDTIIIDSLSHAWVGSGGTLEKHGNATAKDPRGNSYAAWREVTPAHNGLVDAILQSPCHIIATMRAKTEYVQDKDENGKTTIRKVGLSPVMRDGIEYEFTVFLDMDQKHNAFVSKTRIDSFDGKVFVPTKDTGAELLAWLNDGTDDNSAAIDALKREIRANPKLDLEGHEATLEAWKAEEPETYQAAMAYMEKANA
jgi:hypothetical protein